jgi:hypothetical protein
LFAITGTFDAKTGQILSFEHEIYESTHQKMQNNCFVQPQWGEDYVDEKCYEKNMQRVEKYIVNDLYPWISKGSVYRQCEGWRGEE